MVVEEMLELRIDGCVEHNTNQAAYERYLSTLLSTTRYRLNQLRDRI